MTNNGWLDLCWSQFWQVTALVLVVLLTNRWTSRRRPQLACLLWLIVLLKCLTPPIVAAPWSPFGIVNLAMTSTADTPSDQCLLATSDGQWNAAETIKYDADAAVVDASFDALPERPANDNVPVPRPTLPQFGFVVWTLGALVVCLTFTVRCWQQLRKLKRDYVEVSSDWQDAVNEVASRLKMQRRTEIVVTKSNIGPAIVGIWKPRIVLPIALVNGRQPADLEPVIAHELIHLRRGDLWLSALQWLVQTAWWFHPLVRLGNHWMNRDAERCCDEAVIAEMRYPPARYARMLIEVLSLKQKLQPMPWCPGVRPVDVTSQRLERIMRLGQGSLGRTPWKYWLVAIAIGIVVLPGAWIGLTAEENGAPADMIQVVERGLENRSRGRLDWVPTGHWTDEQAGRRDDSLQTTEVSAEPQTVVIYNVEGPLSKLKESGAADIALIADLTNADVRAEATLRSKRQATPKYALTDDGKLVVRHTQAGHQRVAKMLQSMERFGFGQITVEVRVVTIPSKRILDLGVKWKLFETNAASATSLAEANVDALPPNHGAASSNGAYTIEKRMPMLYATIGPRAMKSLIGHVQSHADSNMMMAPKVTLFNGQVARIADTVQRPFVVGLKTLGGESSSFQPQIRVVEDGWWMDVRVVTQGKKTWLDCDTTFSQIRDVEVRTLPIKQQGKAISLQVPEVATAQMDVAMTLAKSQTLLLHGVTVNEKGDEVVLLMITPRQIDESTVTTKMRRADKSEKGAEARRADQRYQLPIKSGEDVDNTSAPPTDDQVMAALERKRNANKKIPFVAERELNDVRIVKEKIADYVDPTRYFPLIGPAKLHHRHYKCTVSFTETTRMNWPTPQTLVDNITDVIYVDAVHLKRDPPKRPSK